MTTFDPRDPTYVDEKSVRDELTRVFDVCHGCRSCVELCAVFPTLFEMLDHPGSGADGVAAGDLSPSEQDEVVDTCSQCQLCSIGCPGGSGPVDAGVDLPRTLLRAQAMRHANGQQPIGRRRTTRVLGRADRIGKLATAMSAPVNRFVTAPPGSVRRRLLAAVTGLSASRRLPPYASPRWSSWMRHRPAGVVAARHADPPTGVTVFPTCVVEYQDTTLGRDLVASYEHVGVGCTASAAACCGAPLLQTGDLGRFAKVAKRNVRAMAEEIHRHGDLVVGQPVCAHVIRDHYVLHAPGPDADLVAAHAHDATDHLMRIVRGSDERPSSLAEQPPRCTYVAAGVAGPTDELPGRQLLELAGFDVTEIRQSSGTDGLWGLRAENDGLVASLTERIGERGVSADGGVLAGESVLANAALAERGGPTPLHPVQLFARHHGIHADS